VLEAYRRRLLSREFARDKADDELDADLNDLLLSLSTSSSDDEMMAIVSFLSSTESSSSEDRILYLVVAYLRHCETDKERILDLMEEVYADFDYPNCIANTIRYMPMNGPDLGSKEANEDRLLANIDKYLGVL
jgi:hypothetical protein